MLLSDGRIGHRYWAIAINEEGYTNGTHLSSHLTASPSHVCCQAPQGMKKAGGVWLSALVAGDLDAPPLKEEHRPSRTSCLEISTLRRRN